MYHNFQFVYILRKRKPECAKFVIRAQHNASGKIAQTPVRGAYILSSIDRPFRCIPTHQCYSTREIPQAEIETVATLYIYIYIYTLRTTIDNSFNKGKWFHIEKDKKVSRRNYGKLTLRR